MYLTELFFFISVVHNWGFIESYSMPGMCMDVDGNPGVRDGANVQLWSCEKSRPQTSDQIWDIMVSFLSELYIIFFSTQIRISA